MEAGETLQQIEAQGGFELGESPERVLVAALLNDLLPAGLVGGLAALGMALLLFGNLRRSDGAKTKRPDPHGEVAPVEPKERVAGRHYG